MASFVSITSRFWIRGSVHNKTKSTICIWFCLFRWYDTYQIINIYLITTSSSVVMMFELAPRTTKNNHLGIFFLLLFISILIISYQVLMIISRTCLYFSLLLNHEVCTSFCVTLQFLMIDFRCQTVRKRRIFYVKLIFFINKYSLKFNTFSSNIEVCLC